MHHAKFRAFFDARRERRRPLVLATVIATSGSTYSKPGARMLIDENGIFQGMLSGGCLEGDLAIRAQQVLASGAPQIAVYDLAEDDELWGLGVGCDGRMEIFLQPLRFDAGYEPLPSLIAAERGTSAGAIGIVTRSDVRDVPAGGCILSREAGVTNSGLPGDVAERIAALAEAAREAGEAASSTETLDAGSIDVFRAPIHPQPRLLVLGGGLDAEPLVNFAAELGWRCTVFDHRPAYIANNDFSGAEEAVSCPAGEVSEHTSLDTFDAAIVMSHHLDSDRRYLAQLADADVAYVGLLGPAARRERLLEELGAARAGIEERLHGPAGLDLGARGPAAIALSIVAQVLRHFSAGRSSGRRRRTGSSE